MDVEPKARPTQVVNNSFAGSIWFAGWLFTLAFLKLIWWKALLGLIIWPYYLGVALR
jgi:hypothetical protein